MTPLKPFKLEDYSNWITPKSLPIPSPDIPAMPRPTLDPEGGDNGNALLYASLAFIGVIVIVGGIYMYNENVKDNYRHEIASIEMKKITDLNNEVESEDNFLTNS